MNNINICSQFEICEELPIAQKTLCYQQLAIESERHHVMMDHIGEGILITAFSLFTLFIFSGICILIKDSLFE